LSILVVDNWVPVDNRRHSPTIARMFDIDGREAATAVGVTLSDADESAGRSRRVNPVEESPDSEGQGGC